MITKLYSFHHSIQYDLNKNALIAPQAVNNKSHHPTATGSCER